ncbi:DUF4298 domain-containing protein [Vaginisenegalia massiliensis]|uniref:DUF4298 domain-containing protein n=1 Tax=Vaginisenegalia massiliensis TaxID=2058294 RepID=UPI000F53BFDA|nr:DUF4298 domain-containing protein [Vaginisenegalia massiliensis]
MNLIKRIEEMEATYDHSQAITNDFEKVLEAFTKDLNQANQLVDYYGSAQWFEDVEQAEQGKVPNNLKRGVLSEDLVYDYIVQRHQIGLKLLEVARNLLD